MENNVNELTFSVIDSFDLMTMEDGGLMNKIGEPSLPLKIFQMIIPVGNNIDSIVIDSLDTVEVTGDSGQYYIYPAQPNYIFIKPEYYNLRNQMHLTPHKFLIHLYFGSTKNLKKWTDTY